MGLEFLSRIRRSAIVAGAIVALMAATYAGWRTGVGVALGVAWSLVNLFLLERLVVAITSEGRGAAPTVKRAVFAALGMLALFAAGGMLLTALPPLALLAGFVLPLAVLVLKAASLLLLESRAWRWTTANPWRATIVVLSLVVAAWWAVPAMLDGRANAAPVRLAQAPHGAADQATTEPATTEHATTEPATTEHATTEHATTEPASAEHATAEHEQEGPEKFPNVITVLSRAFPNEGWAQFLHHNEAVIFAFLVGFLLIIVAVVASRAPKLIPTGLQNLVEALVEGLHGFIAGIIGDKHADRFVPFLGTLGIYIWAMNLFGLIPFMDSPTSNLNITFSLAIVVFLYAQYVGIRGLGVIGYIDHLMGQPRNLTGWLLVPLMLPIHILGELAKPISLSCRLFGNIFGEDMLLVAFVSLGVTTLAWSHLPIGLPLQLPFLLLALLTSTLQAMVFMVLSTIYILLMLPHDEHEAHEGAAAHAAH